MIRRIISKLYQSIKKPSKPRAVDTVDKRLFKKLLKTDAPVIVEAGVFDGRDTTEFARLFPKGIIYGFECDPENFQKAVEKVKDYKNIVLSDLALSDRSGELLFYRSEEHDEIVGSGSILPPKEHLRVHPNIKFEKTIKAKSTRLDEWARQHHIDRIDLLWLDLQGAEMKALEGMGSLIDQATAIFTEVSLVKTYHDVLLYDEFRSVLKEKGFEVSLEFLPYPDMGNVLFINTNL